MTEAEWASADWWSWPAVAEVLGAGEAGRLTSVGVGKRSSLELGLASGLEQTFGQGQTSGLGLGVAEELLQEDELLGGWQVAERAVSAGKVAGDVAEEEQGLVAGRRGLVGHRVAAVVPDTVPHTMLGLVVGGEAGLLAG